MTAGPNLFGDATLSADGCATCGDMAIPVRVIEVHGQSAIVEDRLGQQEEVAVDFVPGVEPGDIVLVHMRVAIARVAGNV